MIIAIRGVATRAVAQVTDGMHKSFKIWTASKSSWMMVTMKTNYLNSSM